MKPIKKTKSKFLKVRCENCKKNQTVYSKASTIVKCLSCNAILSNPKGGKCKINGKIIEVME